MGRAPVIESGLSKVVVSQLLGIARSTLTEWHNQHHRNGEVAAKQGYQQGHRHKITDWREFRAFAEAHGEKTQAEMVQLWPNEISDDTIGRALKRIGFTRKKRPLAIRPSIQPQDLIFGGVFGREHQNQGWRMGLA